MPDADYDGMIEPDGQAGDNPSLDCEGDGLSSPGCSMVYDDNEELIDNLCEQINEMERVKAVMLSALEGFVETTSKRGWGDDEIEKNMGHAVNAIAIAKGKKDVD